MKKKITTVFILLSYITLPLFNSCKKDQGMTISATEFTDKDLFEIIKTNTNNLIWFNNSGALLNRSSSSGHSAPFLRTGYNSIAATKLNSSGKVISGTAFPEGSLIIKELYSNATTLDRYAVLYKKSNTTSSDSKGWVWGYILPNGSVAFSVTKKGSSCNDCHSQSNNIDYMLMNKYFP